MSGFKLDKSMVLPIFPLFIRLIIYIIPDLSAKGQTHLFLPNQLVSPSQMILVYTRFLFLYFVQENKISKNREADKKKQMGKYKRIVTHFNKNKILF